MQIIFELVYSKANDKVVLEQFHWYQLLQQIGRSLVDSSENIQEFSKLNMI